jgi:predicted nucleic acid-binding protein
MTSKHAIMRAVLDANVLYSAPLRNYLLHLASLQVYDPLWTDAIHEEWVRSLLKVRPDIDKASLETRRRLMDSYFYRSKVMNYDSIIDSLSLPDPKDRHVLAAAIKGKAQVIVTSNLKDFPKEIIGSYGISAMHPDDFVLACIDRGKANAIKALKNQVKYLKNPPLPVEKVLESLKRCGMPKSVELLRTYL